MEEGQIGQLIFITCHTFETSFKIRQMTHYTLVGAEMQRKREKRVSVKTPKKAQIDVTFWGETQEERYRRYEEIMKAGQATANKVTAAWCQKNPPSYPIGWAQLVFKPKQAHQEFIAWAVKNQMIEWDYGPQVYVLNIDKDEALGDRMDLKSALIWYREFGSVLTENRINYVIVDTID